jgi:hypothetical protein
MKRANRRFLFSVVGGVLLIAAGVIFLLSNLGMITIHLELFIGPMFAIAGLVFLLVFITNTDEWWALIPGFILFGMGINIFMGRWLDAGDSNLSGAIFLAFVGLPFFLIYLSNHGHWWAIIPGGVLLTLAGVTLFTGNSALEGGLFFMGLALTFALVYLLPKPSGKLKWALFPAGILFLMALVVILGVTDLLGFVTPIALLLAGGYLIIRATRK